MRHSPLADQRVSQHPLPAKPGRGEELKPDRVKYNRVFVPESGELVRSDLGIRIVVIDVDVEEVVSWVT